MTLFRAGLLEGRTVALSGSPASEIGGALSALGARVVPVGELDDDDDTSESWAREHAPLDVLIHDARGTFGTGGAAALRSAVDEAWAAIRAVAVGALIPAGRGRVMVLAPPAGAGLHAAPVRDALENLARTLSVEWARYGITTTAIAPGPETTEAQLAQLACFIASPAGDYLSGCRFSLGLA
jgi:NAD(P)-dependent dehydrogenase (short-subunit alcohol dehydrogenase family)